MAVVERFKEESTYGLSARTKEIGHCREMAVVDLKIAISVGWTVSQFPVSQVTKFPDPMCYS